MRNRVIAVLAAFKIILLSVWFFGGWGYFKDNSAFAAPTPVEKSQAVKDDSGAQTGNEKGLIAAINRRQKELDAREEDVKIKEERLLLIKKDIEAKIEELKKVRSEIEEFTRKLDEVNNDRIKKLVRIYELMNPEEAAPRLEKLDTKTAVLILSAMSEKKAAKILEFVPAGKSASLSQSLKIKND